MKVFPIFLIVMLALSLVMGTEVLASQGNETVTKDVYPFDQDYHKYFNYTDIQARLEKIHKDHPTITRIIDLTAKTKFGATYQHRYIWGLEISKDPTKIDPDKAKVFILGNIHGDENMGMEICMYTIDYLTDLYGLSPTDNDRDEKINEDPIDGKDNDRDGLVDEDGPEAQVTWLVDTRELFIIPYPNPDGSEYDSQVYAANGGAWRKNMRDNDNNDQFDPNFDGVDLNRNYPYLWNANRYLHELTKNGVTITQDSGNPGSSEYRGPNDNFDNDGDSKFPNAPDLWNQHYGKDLNGIDEDPYDSIDNDHDGKVDEDKDGGFSEPETQAVEAMINMLDTDGDHTNGKSDIAVSLTYHTYAGLVLYPWGYTQNPAPDDALLSDVAHRMAAINGYKAEKGTDLYPTSGDSDDFLYGSMGTLPFTIEVAEIGNGGFHPNPKYIINQSRGNLGVNLYLLEIAEMAKVAKRTKSSTIDIGVPEITHVQTTGTIDASRPYLVIVDINNTENLMSGSLMLFYRTRSQGGGWSDWHSIKLTQDTKNRFTGSIPGQESGTTVQYYIEAKDTRGPTTDNPKYAHAAPYEYNVRGFFGFDHVDPVLVILVFMVIMVLLFTCITYRKKRRLRAVSK